MPMHVDPVWYDTNLERLIDVYNKIKDFYWVRWEGGLAWKWSVKQPVNDFRSCEWRRPTIEDVIERQAMFDGTHDTMRIVHTIRRLR